MHGLKTMNHKLIMPALIFIPLSPFSSTVVAMTVYNACGKPIYQNGQIIDSCLLTDAGYVLVAVTICLLNIWIAAWISFYRAYKYIRQPRNYQLTQEVSPQTQQGCDPHQVYPPKLQQGVFPPQPYPDAPPPYSEVPAAGPTYPVTS